MTDIIERAKATLEGVTEGPWKPCHVGNIHYGVGSGDCNFPNVVHAECGPGGWGNGSRRADAEFIAASRTLVPALIAEVEILRARTVKAYNAGWDGRGYSEGLQ